MSVCATAVGRPIEACTRGTACRCVVAMRNLLHVIAYPRRGTEDDLIDIFEAARRVQLEFTANQLSDDPEPIEATL